MWCDRRAIHIPTPRGGTACRIRPRFSLDSSATLSALDASSCCGEVRIWRPMSCLPSVPILAGTSPSATYVAIALSVRIMAGNSQAMGALRIFRTAPISLRVSSTESFPVQEAHGQLFMYHALTCIFEHGANETPPFPVPRIPEVDDGTFVFRGAHNGGRVLMHILEFAENSADRAHFQPVHGQMRFPWTQLRIPGVHIEHEPDWYVDAEVPWKMYFQDNAVLRIFGRRVEACRRQCPNHVLWARRSSEVPLHDSRPW